MYMSLWLLSLIMQKDKITNSLFYAYNAYVCVHALFNTSTQLTGALSTLGKCSRSCWPGRTWLLRPDWPWPKLCHPGRKQHPSQPTKQTLSYNAYANPHKSYQCLKSHQRMSMHVFINMWFTWAICCRLALVWLSILISPNSTSSTDRGPLPCSLVTMSTFQISDYKQFTNFTVYKLAYTCTSKASLPQMLHYIFLKILMTLFLLLTN